MFRFGAVPCHWQKGRKHRQKDHGQPGCYGSSAVGDIYMGFAFPAGAEVSRLAAQCDEPVQRAICGICCGK